MKLPMTEQFWFDATTAVVRGAFIAIPAAFLCWVVYRAGWSAAPALALPMYCTYKLGQWWAQDAWSREFDAKVKRLSEDCEAVLKLREKEGDDDE